MKCRFCNEELIYDTRRSELICPNCAIVYEERMPVLVQERTFGEEEKMHYEIFIRAGAATIIGKNSDYNILSPQKAALFRRLRKINSGGLSTEKNFFRAYQLLTTLKGIQPFSDEVIKTAFKTYKWASGNGFVIGKKLETMLASAVWLGVKVSGKPYLLSDIVSTLKDKLSDDLKPSDVLKNYAFLKKSLKINEPHLCFEDYVRTYFGRIGLDENVIDYFSKINLVSGKLSALIGAGIYYYTRRIPKDKYKKVLSALNKETDSHFKRISKELVAKYMHVSVPSITTRRKLVTDFFNEGEGLFFQPETTTKS